MKTKSVPSEAEIDAIVVAEADDDDAWEAPETIPPSLSSRSSWMTEGRHLNAAAKFYVLSVLHRLGAEANTTVTDRDSVDITVVRESGDALTIDVKTLRGTKTWPIEQLNARKHHFIVFVCYPKVANNPSRSPQVYVIPSRRLRTLVRKTSADRLRVDTLGAKSKTGAGWRDLVCQDA